MISALIVILILMGGAAGAGVLIIAFMDPELNPRDGTQALIDCPARYGSGDENATARSRPFTSDGAAHARASPSQTEPLEKRLADEITRLRKHEVPHRASSVNA